mmetsp:Transcript_102051/g.186459  ORF Transcript_102051/g.186459 Transcript_102051/m.186459 type:complete len:633 (+) Transcript_102051:75-1973(+)
MSTKSLLPDETPKAEVVNESKDWKVIEDEDALGNLMAYKAWMLAENSWIHNRKEVERAFYIIEKDIPVSLGANGDVEDLVVGPALPYAYWCNAWTWSSFWIILAIAYWGVEFDQNNIAKYPTNAWGIAIFGVFSIFTGRAMWLEYCGAMYVLPSQAISSGGSLFKMQDKKKEDLNWREKITFNQWLVFMLIISFFFHVDICSTAIFIARVLKTSSVCTELDDLWQQAMSKSFLRATPMSLPYTILTTLGTIVMFLQLLYAVSFSVPVSPNLSVGSFKKERTKGWRNCWKEALHWCTYEMADVLDNEVLAHKIEGRPIGSPGDYIDRPPHHHTADAPFVLHDYQLYEDADDNTLTIEEKKSRAANHLDFLQRENNMPDTYEMRLARHRRARIAIFNSMWKHDMGYGRAVQALVESGRMNLMQWQDDNYLEQAEHNWDVWQMVQEIRRTNIRFFLFALQAAFFPFFQITFFGVVASHDAIDNKEDEPFSNAATAASTIVGTIIGVKYLWYEFKSVRDHERFATVAIEAKEKAAEDAGSQRVRWEATRLRRRSNMSWAINIALFALFFMIYAELVLKVVMVMVVCAPKERLYNVKSPFSEGGMAAGCVSIHQDVMCWADTMSNHTWYYVNHNVAG